MTAMQFEEDKEAKRRRRNREDEYQNNLIRFELAKSYAEARASWPYSHEAQWKQWKQDNRVTVNEGTVYGWYQWYLVFFQRINEASRMPPGALDMLCSGTDEEFSPDIRNRALDMMLDIPEEEDVTPSELALRAQITLQQTKEAYVLELKEQAEREKQSRLHVVESGHADDAIHTYISKRIAQMRSKFNAVLDQLELDIVEATRTDSDEA